MKYFKTTFSFHGKSDSNIDGKALSIARELCPAIAGELGYESFEDTDNGVSGYIQQQLYDEALLKTTFASFPLPGIRVKYETETIEDKNWNEEWEKNGFSPIIIGDRCIVHDTEHNLQKHYEIDIVIDAHQAFGTGTHDTTQMIIGEMLETDLKGKKTLDCGCGTGILSITAAKLGASVATGYDIDEWSVRNTEHNAQLNAQHNIRVFHGDSSTLTNKILDEFDLAMANINRNILLNDLPRISKRIKNGGQLIISGFYTSDAEALKEKAAELRFTLEGMRESNGWCMLRFKKN